MSSPTSLHSQFSRLSLRTSSTAGKKRPSLSHSAPSLSSTRGVSVHSQDDRPPTTLIESIVQRESYDKHLLLSHLVTGPKELFLKVQEEIVAGNDNTDRTFALITFCKEWTLLFAHTQSLIEASDPLAAITVVSDKRFETIFQESINQITPLPFQPSPISARLSGFLTQTNPSKEFKAEAQVLRELQLQVRRQLKTHELMQYLLSSSQEDTAIIRALSEFDLALVQSISCPCDKKDQPQFFKTLLRISDACIKAGDFATARAIHLALKPLESSEVMSAILKKFNSRRHYEQLERLSTGVWDITYGRFQGKIPVAVPIDAILARLDQIRTMPSYISEEKMIVNAQKLQHLWQLTRLSS